MDEDPEHVIDDIELAAVIAAAMQSEGHVPASVTLDVSDAVVTLEGEVETEEQRDAAEFLVRDFKAVAGIINRVTLRAPPGFAADRPVSG